jgi:hypothetical protein
MISRVRKYFACANFSRAQIFPVRKFFPCANFARAQILPVRKFCPCAIIVRAQIFSLSYFVFMYLIRVCILCARAYSTRATDLYYTWTNAWDEDTIIARVAIVKINWTHSSPDIFNSVARTSCSDCLWPRVLLANIITFFAIQVLCSFWPLTCLGMPLTIQMITK